MSIIDNPDHESRLTAVEQEVRALSGILAEVLDPYRIVSLEFRVVVAACHHCKSSKVWGPIHAYDMWKDEYSGWTLWCEACKQDSPVGATPVLFAGTSYRLHAIARVTRAGGEVEEGFADPGGTFVVGEGCDVVWEGGERYIKVRPSNVPHSGLIPDISFNGTFDGTGEKHGH